MMPAVPFPLPPLLQSYDYCNMGYVYDGRLSAAWTLPPSPRNAGLFFH